MADLVYPPVVIAIKGLWKYLGLKFDFQGDENIPRKGGAILAINHVGYLDFALVGTAALPVNRYVRFMAKKEIFDNKLAGPLMRGMHHISVDRANGSASFGAALRALRAGAARRHPALPARQPAAAPVGGPGDLLAGRPDCAARWESRRHRG